MLGACTPSTSNLDHVYPVKPPGMEDCKVFRLDGTNSGHITVVRCPNSSTTTQEGTKSKSTAIVIDNSNPFFKQETPKPAEPPASVVINGIEYKR